MLNRNYSTDFLTDSTASHQPEPIQRCDGKAHVYVRAWVFSSGPKIRDAMVCECGAEKPVEKTEW
jgi:hypothetical protein